MSVSQVLTVDRRFLTERVGRLRGESLAELRFREVKSIFGRRYVYFCSRCRKILGVSHRKGFWMG